MPELFLLVMMMTAVLVLLAGLMVIFRGWMRRRDAMIGGGMSSPAAKGHGQH